MKPVPRLLSLALGVGLSAAVPLALTTTVASAAVGDSVTVDGSSSEPVITGNQNVDLAGVARPTCSLGGRRRVDLVLSGPGVSDETIDSTSVGCRHTATVAGSLATASSRNGHYELSLDNDGTQTMTAFDLRVAPAAPRGFAATADGTSVTLTWTANSEPDITSYDIRDGAADATPGGIDPAADCSGGGCATTLDLGAGAAGTTHSFAVRALRCGATCDSSEQIAGPVSSSSNVTFPSAAPSTTSTPIVSVPASPGGSTTSPHSTPGQRGTSTPGGSASPSSEPSVSPSASPSASTTSDPSTTASASDRAAADQKLNQSPGAGGRTLAAKGGHPAAKGITSQLTSNVQRSPVWRSLAAGVVLLLLAAHLWLWSRRMGAAQS